jgi:hypothetical protein
MLLHDVTQEIAGRSQGFATKNATNGGFPPVIPFSETRQYGAPANVCPQDADADSFGDPKRVEET